MGWEQFAILVLTGISNFLGISSIPGQNPTDPQWLVSRSWEAENGFYVFEATSTKLVESCRTNISKYVQFPTVIHGAHEIFGDTSKLEVYGDPTFRHMRSFYGSPFLSCSQIAGEKSVRWKAYSYTKYFARFSNFPKLSSSIPRTNFFAESMNLIAAGSLAIIALFTVVVFWGKVPNALTFSLALSNLSSSIYFIGTVAGVIGIQASMLTMHKIADFGIWGGLALFFNGLRLYQLVGNKLYFTLVANIILGLFFILIGTTGDAIQFGTTLPFGLTLSICFVALFNLTADLYKKGINRQSFLNFLSMSFFLTFLINDILVVMGLSGNYVLLAIGFISGLLFFGLSVNERIRVIYSERDYLRSNLEKEVQKKTADLQLAMNTLREAQAEIVQSAKMASLGTLSAGIAHEINNSLNYVYGSIHPLEKLIQNVSDEPVRTKASNLLKIMTEGLQLTFSIIKSLRTYTGLNQAKFNEVYVKEIVDSVLTILKNRIRDKIKVKVSISNTIKVYGDVVGLNQILMNLVTNAIDAISDIGDIEITTEEKAGRVLIHISDTGQGISPEIQQRIFEPFFTTKPVGKGTGLGLYIVKMEVEKHHGKLAIVSNPGRGTTFTVNLPTSDTDTVKAAA